MDWQPIRTAPRDGSEIVAYAASWDITVITRWVEWSNKAGRSEGQWSGWPPTPLSHWFPLPPKPDQ